MDDSDDEPIRPASGPPKYLPRIKYEEPDPEAAEETDGEIPLGDAPVTQKPKPKAISSAPAQARPVTPKPKPSEPPPKKSGGGLRASSPEPRSPKPEPRSKKNPTRFETSGDPKPHLIEQTPEGETFEGRRRIRLIISGVACLVLLISLIVVWRTLRSDDVDVDSADTSGQSPDFVEAAPQPKRTPADLEAAAAKLLVDARSLEQTNKSKQALAKVEKVLSDYAETPSAKIALAARERNRQGLPLFVDGAAIVAEKSELPTAVDPPAEADPPATEPVEVAAPPVRPLVAPNPVPMVANPPGPLAPEPRRPIEIGLPRANVAARPLPSGFRARAEAGVHASGWPLEIICERDGGTMMLVPGDRFIQGRDDGRPEERPAHRVQLSSFYIDQHETTGRQFAAFRPDASPIDDRAAIGVSLNDARAYAQWAGKVLPTEAQWEMAARTTDARLHPWGNAAASWKPDQRRVKQIDPVMSFPDDMSPYGVFDLAGNAWEWTNDWFDTKYYGLMKGQTTMNPTGPTKGAGRIAEVVIKGGSKDWDAAWRTGMRPDAKLPYLGFRCVLNLEGGVQPPAGAAPMPVNTPPPSGGAVPF